ncbi:MAG: hypothetical protein WAN36_01550 [Calditrichia bacterium]
MFHFSMSPHHATLYKTLKLERYGVVEDKLFSQQIQHQLNGLEDGVLLKENSPDICFCMYGVTPENQQDAENLIKEIFFFPPRRIWLHGNAQTS